MSDPEFGLSPLSAVSKWRRVPVEYASTSEDEYGSNRHASRQGQTRAFSSGRVAQLTGSAPASPGPAGLAAVKQQPREQEEYMRDWTAHSEEIARYGRSDGGRGGIFEYFHPHVCLCFAQD